MHFSQLQDSQQQRSNKESQEVKKYPSMTNENGLISLNNNGTSKQTQAILKQYQSTQFCQQQNGEYTDLDNPEVSLNLQSLIDDAQFNEGFIADILHHQGKHLQSNIQSSNPPKTLSYMPQPVHSTVAYSPVQNSPNSDSNSSFSSTVPSIKEEPLDPEYFSNMQNYLPAFPSSAGPFGNSDSSALRHHLRGQQNLLKRNSRACDKDSDEYRRKRIRNNIAVRKSREKANQRKKEIEEKNRLLLKENEKLNKQLESLTEELNMLKSLVTHFGFSPEQLSRELSRHFDSFQMQHPLMPL